MHNTQLKVEHLDCNVTTSVLTGAAGRAPRAVISKFKSFQNAGINVLVKCMSHM